jgi:hypothetical protein
LIFQRPRRIAQARSLLSCRFGCKTLRAQAEVFAVDARHDLQAVGKTAWKKEDARLTLDMPGNAVYLVRLYTTPGKRLEPTL